MMGLLLWGCSVKGSQQSIVQASGLGTSRQGEGATWQRYRISGGGNTLCPLSNPMEAVGVSLWMTLWTQAQYK